MAIFASAQVTFEGPSIKKMMLEHGAQVEKSIQAILPKAAVIVKEEAKKRVPELTGKTMRSIRGYARSSSMSVNVAVLYDGGGPNYNNPQALEDYGGSRVGKAARARRAAKRGRTGKNVGQGYLSRAARLSVVRINKLIRANINRR